MQYVLSKSGGLLMHVSPWMTATATFFVQLLILFIVAGFLVVLRKNQFFRSKVKIKPLDFWPPILLYFIHEISKNGLSGSFIPEVVIVWLGLTLIVLIWQIFTNPHLTYRKFFVTFWRFSDLFLFFCWIVVGIYVIFEAL
ncbi:hypothetical protein FC95_GL001335 [Lentilactobacillus kefiri DSM 20587 = JCM 5818]|uniref:Integral membrane protein n=2 Tax=Lentilactobacillus kefiri TaxID=33962 RepID=A0A8E1RIS5_LENKE|nr:hypothetical protein FC95_GL001335 [Lentilactobacillus kefiri DSM 20587 = JCM 5818]